MATPVIVGLLGTAAELYIKELANKVGAGIVETLFRQQQIAADLEAIKLQLAAISAFLRDELPGLVRRTTDTALAQRVEFDVVEKVRTIRGAIASLQRARDNGAPQANIQFLASELAGHCDQVFEMGGVLISYGQPYYAAVGVAFAAGLRGYSETAKEEPARIESVLALASAWKPRLQSWLSPEIPDSMRAKLNWLEGRLQLGAATVPSFETWNTHTTREVAISWSGDPETGIQIFAAWFGYWKDRGLDGNMLVRIVPPGLTFQQAIEQKAARPTTPTIPEWWTVKPGVPASRADYEQCAAMLHNLIDDYYACQRNQDPLSKAVKVIEATVATCEDLTKDGELAVPVQSMVEAALRDDWAVEQLADVQAFASRWRFGPGTTAVV